MLQAHARNIQTHSSHQCRAQAELDGIQEEQMRLGELGVRMSPLQAAELDLRKEKVAKLVKVTHAMERFPCTRV